MDQASISSEGSGKSQEGQSKAGPSLEGKTVKKTSRLAVLSVLYVLLGLLCLFCGVFLGDLDLKGTISLIACFLSFSIALVLGIIALVVIAIHRKEVGGCGYAIISIIVGGFFLSVVSVAISRQRECARDVWCKHNLHRLGLAIHIYEQAHDGCLPTPNEWCDLIVDHNECFPRELFRCPEVKGGACHYAFNRNLDGLRLADVPDEVVLIFESDSGWNLSGGEELLKMRQKSTKQMKCNIVFSDFSVRSYYEENLAEEPLRWKP